MNKCVPDAIEAAPPEILKVTYGKNEVNTGGELTPTIVKNIPQITWSNKPEKFYTLIMFDPDAPSRESPKAKEWLHWLVGNIPGGEVAKGQEICQYVGSAPPQKSGLHRYIFLLYEQKDKVQFKEEKLPRTSGSGRPKFSHKSFAEKYDLSKPIAGNFFVAQWDSYVPTVYKQLSGK